MFNKHRVDKTEFFKNISEALSETSEEIRDIENKFGPNSLEMGNAYLKLHSTHILPEGASCGPEPNNEAACKLIVSKESAFSFENSLLYHHLSEDPAERENRLETIESVLVGSLDGWKATDPEKPRNALHTLLDLAEYWKIVGNFGRSETLTEGVAGLCQKHLDPTDSLTVSALSDLAAHRGKREKYDEAESLSNQALEICEANPDAMNLYGPRILMNLAAIAGSRGQVPVAACLLDQALEVAERVPVPNKSQILEVLCNQAKAYSAMNQRERFDHIVARAMNTAEDCWKSDPSLATECMMTLFGLCQAQGRFDEARRISKTLTKLTTL